MPASLQDQLDEITANTRNLVQPERMAVNERAVQELFASGIEEKYPARWRYGPGVHSQRRLRPPGSLGRPACPRAAGPQLLPRPLVPVLRHRARGLARPLPALARVRRAARCHQSANQSARTTSWSASTRFRFPVLTDPGCALAEQFGLAYTIPGYHRDYYRSILVNIPFVNGLVNIPFVNEDENWRLILPATYVIARDRRVLYAEAYADFRVRPEPEEALAVALSAVKL